MAEISSRAANVLENKKNKFQNQEFNDDLGVNYYEFKWRNHDPQIGRFIQIDPLSDEYEYNSTYAFSENKVTSHFELEGLESVSIQGQNKASTFNHHQSKDLSTIELNRKATLTNKTTVNYDQKNSVKKGAISSFLQELPEVGETLRSVDFTQSVSESVTKYSAKILEGDGANLLALTTTAVLTEVSIYMDKVTNINVQVSTTTSYSKITEDDAKNNSISVEVGSLTIPSVQNFTTPGSGNLAKDVSSLSPELKSKVINAIKENAVKLENADKLTQSGLENLKQNKKQ